MEPNPYEAPAAATSAGSGSHRLLGSFEALAVCVLFALLLSAAVHRAQLGDVQAYIKSRLIAVEIICMLAAMLLVPVSLIRSLVLAFGRETPLACMNVLICGLTLGAILAAFQIDAPTLVYAT